MGLWVKLVRKDISFAKSVLLIDTHVRRSWEHMYRKIFSPNIYGLREIYVPGSLIDFAPV